MYKTFVSFILQECSKLDIEFHLLIGEARINIPSFVKDHGIGAVVTDFSPLRVPSKWVNDVKTKLPDNVPFCQVLTFHRRSYSCRFSNTMLNNSTVFVTHAVYRMLFA